MHGNCNGELDSFNLPAAHELDANGRNIEINFREKKVFFLYGDGMA